jgi:hypothetical protein
MRQNTLGHVTEPDQQVRCALDDTLHETRGLPRHLPLVGSVPSCYHAAKVTCHDYRAGKSP